MTRTLIAAAVLAVALAGCTTAQLTGAQNAAPAAGTLLALASGQSTTVADLVAKGALFCNTTAGVRAVAAPVAAGLAPKAASVINASASVVASVCASLEAAAKPVAPPTNVPLDTVPVAVTPAAAALKPTT